MAAEVQTHEVSIQSFVRLLRRVLCLLAVVQLVSLLIDLPGRPRLSWPVLALTLGSGATIGAVLGFSVTRLLRERRFGGVMLRLSPYADDLLLWFVCLTWPLVPYLAFQLCTFPWLTAETFETRRSCWDVQQLVQVFFFVQCAAALLCVHEWARRLERMAVAAAIVSGEAGSPSLTRSNPLLRMARRVSPFSHH
ncbi:hypothetical protein [Candidatus Nitrospira bockiana]